MNLQFFSVGIVKTLIRYNFGRIRRLCVNKHEGIN